MENYPEGLDPILVNVKKNEILSRQIKGKVFVVLFFFTVFLYGYAWGLESTLRNVFQVTAALALRSHSLSSTVNVIRSVVAAAINLVVARTADTFGRFQVIAFLILIALVGNIVSSQATDIAYFAVGTAVHQVGISGLMTTSQLLVLDNSTLRWRMACALIPDMSVIINTWVSGNITDTLGTRWRWGIAMWAFILPLACVPLGAMLTYMEVKARRTEEWKELQRQYDEAKKARNEGKSKVAVWWEYLLDVSQRLDVIGSILVMAMFGLILAPFTLAGGAKLQWGKAKILVPLIIGFAMIPFVMLYEIKFAKYPLLPHRILKIPSIWAGSVLAMLQNIVLWMPADYMFTLLIIGVNQSIELATRITSLTLFVSTITGTFVGLFVVYYRHTKPLIIFGICMWFVAAGLLVRYRTGLDAYGGYIGGVILFGLGLGFMHYSTLTSMQLYVKHEDMAMVTAFHLLMYYFGMGIGSSILGAVWTQTMERQLIKHLGDPELAAEAYKLPFEFIKNHPWGTPIRHNMVMAYDHVQWVLCVVAVCLVAPMLLAALCIKDNYLANRRSLEGKDLEMPKFSWFKRKPAKVEPADSPESPASDMESHVSHLSEK